MPYVFHDVLMPDEIAADVVGKEEYDKVINERDNVIMQRDEALVQISGLEDALRLSKQKYADTFLSSPDRAKREQADDVKKDGRICSFGELFNMKGDYNAL